MSFRQDIAEWLRQLDDEDFERVCWLSNREDLDEFLSDYTGPYYFYALDYLGLASSKETHRLIHEEIRRLRGPSDLAALESFVETALRETFDGLSGPYLREKDFVSTITQRLKRLGQLAIRLQVIRLVRRMWAEERPELKPYKDSLYYTSKGGKYIERAASLMERNEDATIVETGKGRTQFWRKTARPFGNKYNAALKWFVGAGLCHKAMKWQEFRENVFAARAEIML